jgi:Mu-like prophage major head subunit gpT
MAMTRAQFAKLLQDGLNTVWGLEYKQYPEEWRRLYQVETSKKAFEEDQLVTGFGAAVVKGEGAGISFDEAQQGWTSRYQHETIALAFTITQEAVEDNLYMTMGAKYAKALARSMQHTKEIKGAAILNNAFNAGFVGGDGKSLLAIDHPLVGGGVQSNKLATPADIAEASLEDILIQIRKTRDDRGIPIALRPTDLVIPPELEFTAIRLLESTLRPGLQAGATAALNDVNAINRKSVFGKEPIIITRLTDADAWFVKTDVNDGMKMFQRVAIATKMEEEFNTTNWKYRARERYSYGWSDFRGLYGSEGA